MKLLIPILFLIVLSCNDSKNEKKATSSDPLGGVKSSELSEIKETLNAYMHLNNVRDSFEISKIDLLNERELWSLMVMENYCPNIESDFKKQISSADTSKKYFRVATQNISTDKNTGDTLRYFGPFLLMDRQYRVATFHCDSGIQFKKIPVGTRNS